MTTKIFVYLISAIVFAIVSIYAGIRSRMRVRALMDEEVPAAKPSAIPRPGVERFLGETRVLRQLVDGLVEETVHGIPGELHDDTRAVLDVAHYSRALADWIRTYERELDDEDREALGARGITASRVVALREPETDAPTQGPGLAEARRLAAELERFEVTMTETPRLAAYR